MYALVKKNGKLVTQWDLYENRGYNGNCDIREDLLHLNGPVISRSKKKLKKLISSPEVKYALPGVMICRLYTWRVESCVEDRIKET